MGLHGPDGLTVKAGPGLRGLRVWMRVLGCRSNLCEGDLLAGDLEARGALISREPDGCRAAILLTCSVTAEADRKCRQMTRRARRAVGKSGLVAVCGCWAQSLDAAEAEALGIDLLVGNRRKSLLADAVEARIRDPEKRALTDLRMSAAGMAGNTEWDELPMRGPVLHTRAFLKIQEGCDHFCAYCVVPFLRGRPVSRSAKKVLEDVRRLVDAGCREVVLTGIHLGLYGRGMETSLADLVRTLSDVSGLERLRLGSLEPFALDGALLDALADSPAFCRHLHLPLQSGDDGVLARMRRGYTADGFARVCDAARERLGGDLHISSDILVGFPGEDSRAFQNTLSLMRRVGMGRTHVFPFSPRHGTLAAGFEGRVGAAVLAERAAMASALGGELLGHYARRFVGRTADVLAEEERDGRGSGYTRQFLGVSWPGGGEPGNIVRVRVSSESEGALEGCLA